MIYFTSDTHCHHRKILEYTKRPYSTVEEHDQAIIDLINSTVTKNDQLYILGDVVFPSDFKTLNKFHSKINGNVTYILGNHDKRAAFSRFQNYDYLERRWDGDFFVLSHYPILCWNRCHHGSYHLYGHEHSNIEDICDKMWPQRRSMDVGLDNSIRIFGEPKLFSLDFIKEYLGSRNGGTISLNRNSNKKKDSGR